MRALNMYGGFGATLLQSSSCGASPPSFSLRGWRVWLRAQARSDRYLYRPPPSGCFQPAKTCGLKGGNIIFSSGRFAPSDRYLYRPPPSGGLCAPWLRACRRSAPPAPCAAVLVHGSCYSQSLHT